MGGLRKRIVIELVVSLLVVAGIVGAVVVKRHNDGLPKVCAALDSPVNGLDQFGWDNGLTKSSGSWGQALTDGVLYAQRSDRPRIAATVRADSDGFATLVESAPVSLRSAMNRQRALAESSEADRKHRNYPQAIKDSLAIVRYSIEVCGQAP